MKKGKRCDLVWASPEFDSTKGFRLGRVSNDSNNETRVVTEYFPVALSKHIKSDSPYILHLSVVKIRMHSTPSGNSGAQVAVEGRFTDGSDAVVAAFTAHASETIGGNERDNARLCVRTIVFAMSKDLIPSAIPSNEKSPEIIVADTEADAPSPSVASPAPGKKKDSSVLRSAPMDTAPSAASSAGTTAPLTTPPSNPLDAASPLIPPSMLSEMKRGSALTKLWVSPEYDKTTGFTIGEVRYQVDARNDGIDKYLPEALDALARKDAPVRLHLRIVELTYQRAKGFAKGNSAAKLGVEGILKAPDGTLLAAFTSRQSIVGTGDSVDDCRMAARRVILAIQKDLM